MARSRSIFLTTETPADEVSHFLVSNAIERLRLYSLAYFLINLSRIPAFSIWRFKSDHFKQAHSKCINIDALIIVLFVELRGHELRSP